MIPILTKIEGKHYISGKFAFYMFQTYGIPPEILEDIINEWLLT